MSTQGLPSGISSSDRLLDDPLSHSFELSVQTWPLDVLASRFCARSLVSLSSSRACAQCISYAMPWEWRGAWLAMAARRHPCRRRPCSRRLHRGTRPLVRDGDVVRVCSVGGVFACQSRNRPTLRLDLSRGARMSARPSMAARGSDFDNNPCCCACASSRWGFPDPFWLSSFRRFEGAWI